MTTLPESPTGQQLKEQGQTDVIAADTAINRGAGDHIRIALASLILKGQPFTADDVRDRLPEDVKPHSDNLLPAFIGSAARTGRITAVGWATCTRPERRGGPMRKWIGAHAEDVAA
jgi:hypothetical protein